MALKMSKRAAYFTVLCELGGAEEAGDPERLLGAFQRLIVGRQVGLGEWQLQVSRAVGQAGVLLTLRQKKTGTFCKLAQCLFAFSV